MSATALELAFLVTTARFPYATHLANTMELVSAPKLANAQQDGLATNVKHLNVTPMVTAVELVLV